MARKRLNDKTLRIRGYAAYWEPLRPAWVLARQGRRLRREAEIAEVAANHRAEQLYRDAIERLVDAFLVDRSGHALCFTEAHKIGRHVSGRWGCPMTADSDGYWTVGCGILALHRRMGASWAGTTLTRCSVCGADAMGCDHIPGVWYDDVHCHRVVAQVDLMDISLTPFPDDPRTYRTEIARSPAEIRAVRGRRLAPGEVPVCTHCTDGCGDTSGGPTAEDVDQTLW